MSLLVPCSTCGSKLPGKLANVTVAWYKADQQRVAYRLKLCVTCYATQIVPLATDPSDSEIHCPVCHSEPVDMDPCFITAYVPDVGKQVLELATCASCAIKIRGPASVQGSLLESQFGGQGTGPQTTPSTASDWAKLGIYPRE